MIITSDRVEVQYVHSKDGTAQPISATYEFEIEWSNSYKGDIVWDLLSAIRKELIELDYSSGENGEGRATIKTYSYELAQKIKKMAGRA